MYNNYISFILILLFLINCKNKPIECEGVDIQIENRWCESNGGIRNLNIKNKTDLAFICKRINQFSEGEEVRIAYSYGEIDLYLNTRKIQAIFTYKNGVVYRVGVGRYVHDEELTNRILELMKINNRCWDENCR
ncbi:hypothetical protein CLV73_1568 [Chryseobacterium geocarposphaerae]|uniref:Uncharacterized protein n=1 Tax=Chryseobacterium geocarposphaerae TaxID=1416776 RepID=A0A2M9C9N4_9FLAO|nr:hypothetical protein CLV73_1568 [Chryseobacterium geocarposphaerae]